MESQQEEMEWLSTFSDSKMSTLRKRSSRKSLSEIQEDELASLASSSSSQSVLLGDPSSFESGFDTFNDFLEYTSSSELDTVKGEFKKSTTGNNNNNNNNEKSSRRGFLKRRRIKKWLRKGSFQKVSNCLKTIFRGVTVLFRGAVIAGLNALIVLLIIILVI